MNSPIVRSISLFLQERAGILGKENRTAPASGQRRLSIGILLQRLLTLLCTSHTGQCAPSLKWYKIHTVQPVPPVAPAGEEGRGQSQGGQARSRGKTLPGVLVPRGRGFGQGGGRRLPLRQGARSSHHVHHGQCHPRGHGAGGAQCQPRSHPSSLFPTRPNPWHQPRPLEHVPVLEPGKAPQPPGNSDRWETEKICWNEALKKQRWSQEQQKVPLWLVFPTMIKTSISAPARAISGREFGRGWLAGSAPHKHSRAMLLLLPVSLPAALNTRGGTGEGLGCRAGGGWISKMYRFASSIYNQ